MIKNRDDFPGEVIRISKLQAAFICSRPTCRRFTVAPSLTDEMLVQYNGKVAHITAAAPGGPRYDKDITEEQRRNISNSIFLCSNCADLIDKNNGIDYKTEALKEWKDTHHEWVLNNLNKSEANEGNNVINSYNQSGLIMANVVNFNSTSTEKNDTNKDHDIKIHLKSEVVFNEDLMHELYTDLMGNADCWVDDITKLENIDVFFKKAGNGFLNPVIDSAKISFKEKIEPLTDFVRAKFDKWPYNQNISNFRIQLKPDYLRDTMYKKMSMEDREKWDELFVELQDLLNTLYNSYNYFRKIIKSELHI